jgi:hypothetical protein
MQLTKTTFFLFLMAVAACKQETKTATSASTGAQLVTATAANVKPEVILYAVNVDNLQLRDQPNTKASQVIAKFREGSFVTGAGEKSTNQEEINLRGIPFKDYFYKVTSTTPEQQTGWAFGGALTAVYAGSRAGSPDLGTLVQYSTYLMGLSTKDINSGRKVWDYVNTNFGNASGALADAVYVLTVQYLSRMEYEGEFYTITEKHNWTPEDYEAIFHNTFDMNKYPITKRLAENGFRVETGEGMVFPIADWARLHAFFSPKATPAMKLFLDQQLLEQKDLESEDGGLVVSVATLAERAVFWEKFNQAHPWFLMSERTKINEEWQRNVVVSGLDNTPNRDYETGKINEEFKKVWLEIPQKYPGTVLAAKIKALTDLCAANNWTYNETIENWVMKFQEGE